MLQASMQDTRTQGLPAGHPALAANGAAALEAIGTAISMHKGGEICAQGEAADYAYRIVGGVARVVKLMADGRRQITEFLMPGDWFGMELASELDVTVEAVTAVQLRRYKRHAVEQIAASDLQLSKWRLYLLSEKLYRVQERLLTLGRRTAAERLAGFLLEMDERMPHDRAGVVPLPMNRGDIGDHLGLTVETVSRNFTALEQSGAITRVDTGFRIRDREALDDSVNAMLN